MIKAIGSKVNLKSFENEYALDFMDCIKDIYNNEKVQKLDVWEQHNHTSRLQHSINVAYYSYLFCRKMGWDYQSAARAGLLHDLYFYDWRKPSSIRGNHALWHPLIALDNAKKICDVNEIEADSIKKHMWPCTIIPPKYKEGYVITMADKICAVAEFFDGLATVQKAVVFIKRRRLHAS